MAFKILSIPFDKNYFWTVFIKYDEFKGIEVFKNDSLNEAEKVLLGNLKEWRKEEAQKIGVPSYVIAKNEYLIEIVKQKPKTLQELKLINGIGEKKIKDYGEKLLEMVSYFYGEKTTKS